MVNVWLVVFVFVFVFFIESNFRLHLFFQLRKVIQNNIQRYSRNIFNIHVQGSCIALISQPTGSQSYVIMIQYYTYFSLFFFSLIFDNFTYMSNMFFQLLMCWDEM